MHLRSLAAGLGLAALVAVLVSASQGPRNTLGGDTLAVPAKSIRSYYATGAPHNATGLNATATSIVTLEQSVAATSGLILTDVVASLNGPNAVLWAVELLENSVSKARFNFVGTGGTVGPIHPMSVHLESGIPIQRGALLEVKLYATLPAGGTQTIDCLVSGYVW